MTYLLSGTSNSASWFIFQQILVININVRLVSVATRSSSSYQNFNPSTKYNQLFETECVKIYLKGHFAAVGGCKNYKASNGVTELSVALEDSICGSWNWPMFHTPSLCMLAERCMQCWSYQRGKKKSFYLCCFQNTVEQQLCCCAMTIWTRNDVNTGWAKANTLLTRLKLQPWFPKSQTCVNYWRGLLLVIIPLLTATEWSKSSLNHRHQTGYKWRWGGLGKCAFNFFVFFFLHISLHFNPREAQLFHLVDKEADSSW